MTAAFQPVLGWRRAREREEVDVPVTGGDEKKLASFVRE